MAQQLDTLDTEQLQQLLSYGSIGFGVLAWVTPKLFNTVYGLPHDPGTVVLTRGWGTRTAALGVIGLLAPAKAKKQFAAVGTVVNAIDAATEATAATGARARVLATLSSGVFGAAYGYVWATL